METKIDETYHVASNWGKSLFHLSFAEPLYHEGKVYVLRTATTSHMVRFIDFYFHVVAKFQT